MTKSNEPSGPDWAGLEFPDWSGMDDTTRRISPDAAFQLCEQYPALFPEEMKRCRSQRPEKCLVEFML